MAESNQCALCGAHGVAFGATRCNSESCYMMAIGGLRAQLAQQSAALLAADRNITELVSKRDADLAAMGARVAEGERERSSLLEFCRSRIAQCIDMDAQGIPHPGAYREGRVSAFLAVIARLDLATPVKP